MKIEVIGNEQYSNAIPSETGNFRKWLKINHPQIEFIIPHDSFKYSLHDYSLILPFVNLAIEGSLQNYLNLILEYVNYSFRGKLKDESNTIEFKVTYINETGGERKEFYFKGNEEALKNTVKKFNINSFME